MQARRLKAARRATRACALAGCALLTACATEGRSYWSDHGAVMLRPSRHEVGLSFSFGGAPGPREERTTSAVLSVADSIAAAAAPEAMQNQLPGAESVDFKGGRLYIHAPRKKHTPARP